MISTKTLFSIFYLSSLRRVGHIEMEAKKISFDFNLETYMTKDFISPIACEVMRYSEFIGGCNIDELKKTLSISLGFREYDDYTNSIDKNSHLFHKIFLDEFYNSFFITGNEVNESKFCNLLDIHKNVIGTVIQNAFCSEIPLSFNLVDYFRHYLYYIDKDVEFYSKKIKIISKLIIPAIEMLEINHAKSISDITRFSNINYVYQLWSQCGKARYMKNLKVMKSFKDYYDVKTNEFSEIGVVFWHIFLNDHITNASIIFNDFFQYESSLQSLY